ADRAEHVARPASAVAPAIGLADQVDQQRQHGDQRRQLQIAEAFEGEERFVTVGAPVRLRLGGGHPWPCRITSMKRAGLTRIAAPVGHARTQAAPPGMPMHMSHLTACLEPTRASIPAVDLSSPGPLPAPKNSQLHRLGFLGGIAANWMTP